MREGVGNVTFAIQGQQKRYSRELSRPLLFVFNEEIIYWNNILIDEERILFIRPPTMSIYCIPK